MLKSNINTVISLKIKILVLISVILIFFGIIFIRLLLIVFYDEDSINIGSRSVIDNPHKRISIFDRNYNLLVTNADMFSLFAKPKKISNPDLITQQLKQILDDYNYDQIYSLITSSKDFIWIKKNISLQEKERFLNLGGVRGVYIEQTEKRIYPYKNLLSHITGLVGTEMKGLSGIERFIDTEKLQKDLVLSIDIRMQIILHQAIENALVDFKSKAATGIIADPNTGEILALVNKPDFNPNDIKNLDFNNLFNYATQGNIEIGSCMKSLTFAIALDTNTISYNSKYELENNLKIGKYLIQDHKNMHGVRDVSFIFKNSSNIGTTKIILDLGKEKFYSYLSKFGLSHKLNFEILETSTPKYQNISDCKDINLATMSYGYGISYSPMHLINAYIPIVNGGISYNATLIKKDTNQLITKNKILRSETSDKMKQFLYLSVSEGTSRNAKVPGYAIGGKTGTAFKNFQGKYDNKKKISSFIGVMPITDPKYLVLVILDEPQPSIKNNFISGAAFTAAPLAKKIFEKIILLDAIDPESKTKDNNKLIEIGFETIN